MTFEIQTKGKSKAMPSKIVIYGTPKTGKSTLASEFPDVMFIDCEGGLEYLPNEVKATPKLESFEDVAKWLKHIYDLDEPVAEYLALDSLDWLETLAQNRLVKQNNARNITDPKVPEFAYYRGVISAAGDAIKCIDLLDKIYEKHGTRAILIAHTHVKEVDVPEKDPYQRYELKMSKYLGAKAYEWADIVLFIDYSFHVTSDGKTSDPRPTLFTGGSAGFLGGGRMKLPKELPVSYQALHQAITKG